MGWGTFTGFMIGMFITQRLLGAVLFAVAGYFLFDRRGGGNPFTASSSADVQKAFFATTFSVMGHIAKADGRVSEIEIRMARAVMEKLRLSPARAEEAMHLFNDGKRSDFPLDDCMARFVKICRHRRDLHRIFIEIQLQAALADGQIRDTERHVLERVASHLGIPAWELRQLEALIIAAQRRASGGYGQQGYERGRSTAAPARPSLADAYAVLGVKRDASDAEVKKAYRRLMSQHHPDKLAANGLPEDMREVAAEKTREILAAYEQVRESRGMK